MFFLVRQAMAWLKSPFGKKWPRKKRTWQGLVTVSIGSFIFLCFGVFSKDKWCADIISYQHTSCGRPEHLNPFKICRIGWNVETRTSGLSHSFFFSLITISWKFWMGWGALKGHDKHAANLWCPAHRSFFEKSAKNNKMKLPIGHR